MDKIRRMAKRGTLEVEHLLRLAKSPSATLANELDELANEMGWELGTQLPFVPFGDWVAVVTQYCRLGFEGLTTYAADPVKFRFVIGLLEELSSPEALYCLEDILKRYGAMVANDQERSKRLASAFNAVGGAVYSHEGFSHAQNIEALRTFLHRELSSQHEVSRAVAMCALRYFGDDQSIHLLRAAPQMAEHWERARNAAIRSIRRRLKQRQHVT